MLIGWLIFTFIYLIRAQNMQPINAGYQFEYIVRDDKTGDFKTQEETREGDNVKGSYSVAEPTGDLRVVTYNANKESGFNAKVQIKAGTMDEKMAALMRTLPRYHPRNGFPQVEIKVIPPRKDEPVTIKAEEATIPDEKAEIDVIFPDMTETTTVAEEITTDVPNQGKICPQICKQDEEARAHLRPNEDRVQVEMEKVIRAEMQEPTGVNLGVPYDQYKPPDRNYYTKPVNRPTDEIKNFQQPWISPNYNKVVLLPFNVNFKDYLTLQNGNRGQEQYKKLYPIQTQRPFTIIRAPSPIRQTANDQKPRAVYPMYTTGLAFIVMPKM